MRNAARRIGLFTSLAGILAGGSCIFDTRDAQPPEPVGGGGCTLETPEKAFLCMAGALERQQDGDYERSLSEGFVFSPTLTDSLDQNFTGIPVYDGWTKDVEMDVLALLLSDAESTIVDFGDPVALINKNTFVRYSVSYSLEVITVAAPPDTTRYEGVAQIDVRNEGGNWRVTFWNEVETVEGSRTWGFLRGILRLRIIS
jgi:hypothetical protein